LEQKNIAEMMIEELKSKGFNPATSLLPLDIFYPEEEKYHDMYYDKKGTLPSCHPYREII
jgi:peptide methionine sulfoxide reductase MsrA